MCNDAILYPRGASVIAAASARHFFNRAVPSQFQAFFVAVTMEKRGSGDRRAGEKRKRKTTNPERESHPAEAKRQDGDDSRWNARPRRQHDGIQAGGRHFQQPQQIADEAAVNILQNALVTPLFFSPAAILSGTVIPLRQEAALPGDITAAYRAMRGNRASFQQPPPPLALSQPTDSNHAHGILVRQQNLQRQQRIAALAAHQSVSHSLASIDPLVMSALVSIPHATIRPESLNPFGANASFPQFASMPASDQLRLGAQSALLAGMVLPSLQQLLFLNSFASLESQGQVPRPAATTYTGHVPAMQTPSMMSASVPRSAAARLLPPLLPPPQLLAGNIGQPFVRTADLYMGETDDEILSDYQVLLRRQIEFFEALPDDIRAFTAGRRKELSVAQVGIRCKHCAAVLEPFDRSKGSMYFPSTLRALYQAAQNMRTVHFLEKCQYIDPQVLAQLRKYTEAKTKAGYAGKMYWADCAIQRGIYETETGLRFLNDVS